MHIGGLGNRIDDIIIAVRQPTTETAARCLMEAKQALDLFIERNTGYGDKGANRLGLRGQYADINRKIIKLERWLWDGEPETYAGVRGGEGVIEVCQDLIGHLLLTIDMYQRENR